MAKVLVPLADGFEDIEAISIVDILRRGGVEVVTASISGSTEVASAHGVTLKADATFSAVAGESYDAIVLPGGPGTAALKESQPVLARLRRQHDEGRLLCAICAAPTVLVAAGVVDDGIQVTCYPTCQMDLDRAWTPAPVVADGQVITGQAPGCAVLFSLVVLQAILGQAAAKKVARGLVTDVLE